MFPLMDETNLVLIRNIQAIQALLMRINVFDARAQKISLQTPYGGKS